MQCKNILQLGILTLFFSLSTLIFAEEDSSFIYEGFDFLSEEEGTLEEGPSNKFIDASFVDLYNIFSNYSTLTRREKDESWSKYEGKYVRWKGYVTYKGVGESDKKRVGIRHRVGTNIELTFGDNKKELIRMIERGDRITYTGRLAKLIGRNLLLGIVDVNIEEINDVSIEELKEELESKVALLEATIIAPIGTDIDENVSIQSETEEDSKENINVSFNYLYNIFGKKSNLTLIQKKQKWNDYKGKYIRWKGIITYKNLDESNQRRIGVSHKSGTNIELIFPDHNEDLANMIKKGKSITYIGKLGKLVGRNLLCSVVNVEIRKIEGKPVGVMNLATPSSVLPSVREIENKIIDGTGITMSESMAPEVIKEEDLNIKETVDGFLEVSFVELEKVFGRENRMTESQKDRLWRGYRDKYVRWTGKVVSRGLGRISGLRMGIKHKEGTDVELSFDVENKEKVLQTKAGDTITYTGKLINRRGYILPYRLDEGHIEKVGEEQLTHITK